MIHLRPWLEHVTIDLLKPLIWAGFIERVNGIKEIHSNSGGHPGIIDVFIKDISSQSRESSIYYKLYAIIESRFSELTDNEIETLHHCLSLNKDTQHITLANDIEYKDIIEKLQKYLLLEKNENGDFYLQNEPVFHDMIFEYFDNKYLKKPASHESSSFFEMIGNIYIKTGSWKKAEDSLLKYLEKSEKLNDIQSICTAYTQLALVYQYKSDFIKEVECCQKILEYKNDCIPETIVDTFILLGDSYRIRGEFELSLESFRQAEDIFILFPEDRFTLQKARISLSKGFIFNITSNIQEPNFLEISLDLYRKVDDSLGQGTVYIYQGIYELEHNNFDTADELLNKALNISYEGKNQMMEYFIQNLQSQLRLYQGRTEDAFNLCIKSITSKINLGSKHGIADSLMTFVPIIQSLSNDFDISPLLPILKNIRLYYINFLNNTQKERLLMIQNIDNSIDLPILFSDCAIDIFKNLDAKYYLTKAYIEKAKLLISRNEDISARNILLEVQNKYSIPYNYQNLNIQIKSILASRI